MKCCYSEPFILIDDNFTEIKLWNRIFSFALKSVIDRQIISPNFSPLTQWNVSSFIILCQVLQKVYIHKSISTVLEKIFENALKDFLLLTHFMTEKKD